jgi:hypothetical protein
MTNPSHSLSFHQPSSVSPAVQITSLLFMSISPVPSTPYSPTHPKPHTTISTAVLQFILMFVAVYSEDKTTAVGTTEIRIHKG